MDRDQFAARAAEVQSRIFNAKIQNLETRHQIELEKGRGLNVDLDTERAKTQEKTVKLDIQRVKVGIAGDDLSGITSQRALGQQRWAIQLDGESQEIGLLKESIQVRLQSMREKQIKSLLGD